MNIDYNSLYPSMMFQENIFAVTFPPEPLIKQQSAFFGGRIETPVEEDEEFVEFMAKYGINIMLYDEDTIPQGEA
tara:strand:+ start:378 stop:602 length:225 start_codon:yes stop_codon:yes gene_type:complete